jgi:hypothetical protein
MNRYTNPDNAKQWMADHPDDVRCPGDPVEARAWRIERGLQLTHAQERKAQQDRARYEAAMAEKRAWQATMAEGAAQAEAEKKEDQP